MRVRRAAKNATVPVADVVGRAALASAKEDLEMQFLQILQIRDMKKMAVVIAFAIVARPSTTPSVAQMVHRI